MSSARPPAERGGLAMAFLAYGMWGLLPIYWKQLSHVSALEVLCQRVVGSFVFVTALLLLQGRFRSAMSLLRAPDSRRALLWSTALVATNWGLFIWAVSQNRVTEASLGYYINPLLSALLGRVFLGETLRPAQAFALGIAACGVGYLVIGSDTLPWVSLVLATTFAAYGLVRKRVGAGAVEGLAVETALSTPPALIYLLWLAPPFGALATGALATKAWLLGAGVATSIPLLAFAGATRRLRLTTLGMVQYLAPSMQLACAVALYHEPFGLDRAITFGCIWLAVAIYAVDAVRRKEPGMR